MLCSANLTTSVQSCFLDVFGLILHVSEGANRGYIWGVFIQGITFPGCIFIMDTLGFGVLSCGTLHPIKI